MSEKPRTTKTPSLDLMLDRLRRIPQGGLKILDLAAALSHKGHFKEAAQAEFAALAVDDPRVLHKWRLIQARRAPANQFLLLQNDLRTTGFQRALNDRISTGDLVLELGTGSGILAMLAAQTKADHVVTCEAQSLMAEVAEAIIRDNDLNAKISVIPKYVKDLEIGTDLPRRANILISDMFTGALLEAGGLKLIKHARKNLMCSEGFVIPAAATLRGRLVGGSDLERLCRANNPANMNLERFNLFSPPLLHILPERFTTLDYKTFSAPADCFHFDFKTLRGFEPSKRKVRIESTGDGEILGFLQWLRLELSPGNFLESDESSTIAWSRYLHVFPNPISLRAGQALELHMEHDMTSFSVWPNG